jgi:hypothetical protein
VALDLSGNDGLGRGLGAELVPSLARAPRHCRRRRRHQEQGQGQGQAQDEVRAQAGRRHHAAWGGAPGGVSLTSLGLRACAVDASGARALARMVMETSLHVTFGACARRDWAAGRAPSWEPGSAGAVAVPVAEADWAAGVALLLPLRPVRASVCAAAEGGGGGGGGGAQERPPASAAMFPPPAAAALAGYASGATRMPAVFGGEGGEAEEETEGGAGSGRPRKGKGKGKGKGKDSKGNGRRPARSAHAWKPAFGSSRAGGAGGGAGYSDGSSSSSSPPSASSASPSSGSEGDAGGSGRGGGARAGRESALATRARATLGLVALPPLRAAAGALAVVGRLPESVEGEEGHGLSFARHALLAQQHGARAVLVVDRPERGEGGEPRGQECWSNGRRGRKRQAARAARRALREAVLGLGVPPPRSVAAGAAPAASAGVGAGQAGGGGEGGGGGGSSDDASTGGSSGDSSDSGDSGGSGGSGDSGDSGGGGGGDGGCGGSSGGASGSREKGKGGWAERRASPLRATATTSLPSLADDIHFRGRSPIPVLVVSHADAVSKLGWPPRPPPPLPGSGRRLGSGGAQDTAPPARPAAPAPQPKLQAAFRSRPVRRGAGATLTALDLSDNPLRRGRLRFGGAREGRAVTRSAGAEERLAEAGRRRAPAAAGKGAGAGGGGARPPGGRAAVYWDDPSGVLELAVARAAPEAALARVLPRGLAEGAAQQRSGPPVLESAD